MHGRFAWKGINMEEKEFLTNEIQIDNKVEDILRNIEAKILKEALDNFAQVEDEIAGIDKFIEKIGILETIYEKEQKDIKDNSPMLIKEGASDPTIKNILLDIIKINENLKIYQKMLNAMKINIQNKGQRLKDKQNKSQIKDIFEEIQKAYTRYVNENQLVIEILEQIRASIKTTK